jgi:Ser/Thr protein kinase RdoA (MazF antagonist)
VYEYIDDCISYNNFEDAENPEEIAYNAGKCFGAFHMLLSDFPVSMLADTIPDFHNTPKRFDALLVAIENGITNRAFECSEEIIYLISKIKEYSAIYNKLGRTIPVRVTHNDTKLNNILMSTTTNKGVAVIDLDTVMPGSVLYDIGDGIRSACANSFEDETNPEKIFLKIELAKAYIKGYLEEMACSLTYDEVRCIGLSIRVLTYELALRFLTDYINNDTNEMVELDAEVIELYEKAQNSANDYTMYEILMNEVIPKSKKLIEEAESIEIETSEVKKVHEIYLDAINKNNQAFTLMLSALENQDYTVMTQANEKLDEARKLLRDYESALETLAKEHDVEIS